MLEDREAQAHDAALFVMDNAPNQTDPFWAAFAIGVHRGFQYADPNFNPAETGEALASDIVACVKRFANGGLFEVDFSPLLGPKQ